MHGVAEGSVAASDECHPMKAQAKPMAEITASRERGFVFIILNVSG